MELARQLDLLAQGSDINGDVLVLVVMAILWLVGGLAKVLSSKKGTGQQSPKGGSATQASVQRETWQQRLARKAREMQQAAETERKKMEQGARAQTQTAKPRPSQSPSPPPGRVAVRTDQKGDSVMVYQQPAIKQEQQAARQREAKEAILAAGQQAAKESPRPLESNAAPSEPTTPSLGFQPSAIIDYNDPDALKKAVLHYEILSKPLALREPHDEASSF
jgi:hypothetical protein